MTNVHINFYIIFLLWLIMYLYVWYFQLGDVELLFPWHIKVCDLFSEARRSGSPVEAYPHKIHGTGIFSVTKYLHLLDFCGIWLICLMVFGWFFYGIWLILYGQCRLIVTIHGSYGVSGSIRTCDKSKLTRWLRSIINCKAVLYPLLASQKMIWRSDFGTRGRFLGKRFGKSIGPVFLEFCGILCNHNYSKVNL